MIVIPNKFVFLATPRTGSRAISEALIRKYPDAITDYPSNHHDPAPDDNKLHVYTVIRHPVYQMLSWWAHVDVRAGSKRRPLQFAQEYENIMYMPKHAEYRLNIHAENADMIMFYGMTNTILGLENVKVIGKSDYTLNPGEYLELAEYMDTEYRNDMYLWYKQWYKQRV